MKLYAIIWRPVWWSIAVTLVTGRFWRLKNAIEYLNARTDKKLLRLQARNEELNRRLKAVSEKLKR